VILILTGIPKDTIPPPPAFIDLFQPDKIVHLLMFCIYVYLFAKGLFKGYPDKKINMIILAVIISGLLYSGLTELMQKYIFITRKCSIYDFIANIAGCLIGIAVIKIRFRKAVDQNENS